MTKKIPKTRIDAQLPNPLLENIAAFCKSHGLTRTGFLILASEEYLRGHDRDALCREIARYEKEVTMMKDRLTRLVTAETTREEHEASVAADVTAFIETDADAWWADNARKVGTTIDASNWLLRAEGRLDALENQIRSRFDVAVSRERLETVFREKGEAYGLGGG